MAMDGIEMWQHSEMHQLKGCLTDTAVELCHGFVEMRTPCAQDT